MSNEPVIELKPERISPLDEVKADAKYNYLKRLKEQQEEAEHRADPQGTADKLFESLKQKKEPKGDK